MLTGLGFITFQCRPLSLDKLSPFSLELHLCPSFPSPRQVWLSAGCRASPPTQPAGPALEEAGGEVSETAKVTPTLFFPFQGQKTREVRSRKHKKNTKPKYRRRALRKDARFVALRGPARVQIYSRLHVMWPLLPPPSSLLPPSHYSRNQPRSPQRNQHQSDCLKIHQHM